VGERSATRIVRFATYNVHGCIGADGRRNVARVAAAIAALNADVVALQEVDSRGAPRGSRRQLDDLAERTGMVAIPGPTILEPEGDYGNGILSRAEPSSIRRDDISAPGREPRGLLSVVLSRGGEAPVRFSATHLGLSRRERTFQASRILDRLEPHEGIGADVIAGDLNAWWPLGRALRMLRTAFPAHVFRRSFPSRLPLVALDRVLARPDGVLERVDLRLSGSARVASDHLPVVAELSRLAVTS